MQLKFLLMALLVVFLLGALMVGIVIFTFNQDLKERFINFLDRFLP
ncbi:MAG: hypothetical protein QME81_11830 [bacterium]|nr:hypothetical protein [bacterium]